MRKPKTPLLTVNGVILEKGKVLLLKRAIPPFVGYWELPGGHVDYGETVESAIKREMKEELGVSVKIKKLLGVYSDPKRDPRYHTASVTYLLSRGKGKIKMSYESLGFKFFPLKSVPRKLGFGHEKVIKDLKKMK